MISETLDIIFFIALVIAALIGYGLRGRSLRRP